MNRLNEQKADERGKKALKKITSKKDREEYEKEMKKLQVQEGLQKIKEGATEAAKGNFADEGTSTVLQERREKQRKEKMLKMFEEEVIVTKAPQRKSKSRERVIPEKNTEKLQVIVEEEEKPNYADDLDSRTYIPLRVHNNPMMPSMPPTQLMQQIMGYQQHPVQE